jgi:hypothetical protein
MRFDDIDSTCVSQLGYDTGSAILVLIFKNTDKAYEYRAVPDSVHRDMRNSSSKGRFFHDRIAPCFEYRERGSSEWHPPRGEKHR